MADMANNPGRQVNISDSAEIKASLAQMVNLLTQMKTNAAEAAEWSRSMEEIVLSAKQIEKRTKTYGVDLRGVLASVDSVEEKTKAILEYNRKMKETGLKARDFEGTMKALEAMKKETEEICASNKELLPIMARQKRAINENIEAAQAAAGPHGDWDKFSRNFAESMELASKHSLKMVQALKEVSASKLAKDFHSVDGSLASILGRAPLLQKFTKYAQMRQELQNAREVRKKGHVAEYAEKKKDLLGRLNENSPEGAQLREGRAGRFVKDGKVFRNNAIGVRVWDAQQLSREGGGSWISRYFAGRAEEEAAGGRKANLFTKWGGALVQEGEGSWLRGAGSRAAGATEGVLGGAMVAAPYAAAIVGFLAVVKGLFDKNQKMNADIQEQLGGSGIYAGGNVRTAQMNLRQNLTPQSWIPRFGNTYEGNLSIAKSMADAGWSNRGLAKVQGQDSNGMLLGPEGQFQKNTYMYGRGAGLSTEQTMQQTLKLVTQYHQSLESTEDFFVQIDKASKASGIGIIKYIGIIDAVNDKYDRMNKLLGKTLDVMHAISSSGLATAESLKEDFEGLTLGGGKKEIATQAFLNMQTNKDPKAQAALLSGATQDLDREVKDLLDHNASMAGYTSAEKLTGANGASEISRLYGIASEVYKDDPTGAHAMKEKLDQIATLQKEKAAANDLVHGKKGTSAERALRYATYRDNEGSTPTSDIFQTMQTLKGAGFSLNELAEHPTVGLSNLQKNMLTSLLGGHKEDLKKIQGLVNDTSTSAVQSVARGTGKEPMNKDREQFIHEIFGMIPHKEGKYSPEQEQQMSHDYLSVGPEHTEHIGDITQKVSHAMTWDKLFSPHMANALTDAQTKAQKDALADESENIALTTSNLTDLLHNVFDKLFLLIQKPLEAISGLLENSILGPGGAPLASADQKAQVNSLAQTGVLKYALNDKRSRLAGLTDPEARASMQTDIDNITRAITHIGTKQESSSDDSGLVALGDQYAPAYANSKRAGGGGTPTKPSPTHSARLHIDPLTGQRGFEALLNHGGTRNGNEWDFNSAQWKLSGIDPKLLTKAGFDVRTGGQGTVVTYNTVNHHTIAVADKTADPNGVASHEKPHVGATTRTP